VISAAGHRPHLSCAGSLWEAGGDLPVSVFAEV